MLTEARIVLAFTLAVAFFGTVVVFGIPAAMVCTSWLLTVPWAIRVNRLSMADQEEPKNDD